MQAKFLQRLDNNVHIALRPTFRCAAAGYDAIMAESTPDG
jgi:hypothetical protein